MFYIYLYIYIHICYICLYMFIYICIYMFLCVCVCVSAFIHIHVCLWLTYKITAIVLVEQIKYLYSGCHVMFAPFKNWFPWQKKLTKNKLLISYLFKIIYVYKKLIINDRNLFSYSFNSLDK